MTHERDANFFMANLGSEFTRMLSARARNDERELHESAKRALAIADAALALQGPHGREEVLLLKKIINDIPNRDTAYSLTKKEVESYFRPFAMKEMTQR